MIIDLFLLNIVKLMGMGYLCLIVIGNVIVNILVKVNYVLVWINYFGDWGI